MSGVITILKDFLSEGETLDVPSEHLELPARKVGNKVVVYLNEEAYLADPDGKKALEQIAAASVPEPRKFELPDFAVTDMSGYVKQQEREQRLRNKEHMKNLSRYHNKRK